MHARKPRGVGAAGGTRGRDGGRGGEGNPVKSICSLCDHEQAGAMTPSEQLPMPGAG
jgi:hypothetical protein